MDLRYCIVVTIATVLCLPLSAQAVDGVKLINQNAANTGSITPGDDPGFPVTLSKPGSYRLSSNLTAPEGITGILVASPGVTLDLNGFSLISAGSGGVYPYGVTDGSVPGAPVNQARASIRNGHISGFSTAIYMEYSTGVVVEDLRIQVSGSSSVSIKVGAYSRVQHNIIDGNGYIVTVCPGLVIENVTAYPISHRTDTVPVCLDSHNRASNRTYQLLE